MQPQVPVQAMPDQGVQQQQASPQGLVGPMGQ
jgi:hypothetical protein